MTKVAKGQVSISFIVSFVAVVFVIFIMFGGLTFASKNILASIELVSDKSMCKSYTVAYNIWKMSMPGTSTFYEPRKIFINETGAYIQCGDHKEKVMSGYDEKKWI